MKKAFISGLRIISGILSIILPFLVLVKIADDVVKIYEYNLLKWFALLICFLGFYLSGLINRKTPLKLIPLLYLSLLLFIALSSFYFPLSLYLLFFASVGILVTRKEFSAKLKGIAMLFTTGVFVYFLFSQPLILKREEAVSLDQYGNLLNGRTIWDFSEGQAEESELPETVFSAIDDTSFDLKSLENKTLYISFWATWCGPCRKEKPILDRLKRDLAKNPEVVFIDISIDHDKDAWKEFVKQTQPAGLQLLSKNFSRTRALFKLAGIPAHFVVRPGEGFASIGLAASQEVLSQPSEVTKYILNKNQKPAIEALGGYSTTKFIETDTLNRVYYSINGANRVLASDINTFVEELRENHKDELVYIRVENFPLENKDSIIYKAEIRVTNHSGDYERHKSTY